MAVKIFVNLPAKHLERSMKFFAELGFEFDPRFTDKTAACMIVSDDIFVMLLTEEKFKTFTPKEICNAGKCTEVLVCLTCEGREEVDETVRKAVAAGGRTYSEPKDYGFMYQHGFEDSDGHIWELIFMEPEASNQGYKRTVRSLPRRWGEFVIAPRAGRMTATRTQRGGPI